MDLGTGIALLIAFLAVVVLIVRGQSPIIMLLILAVLWSAIAGIGIDDIQKKILQAGGVAYASAVIIIVFGAWFAQILIQTGIAESVIRSAVELAGDRPLVTAMTVTLVTALLFTSMYGVGAAIAIGIIALPIMLVALIPLLGSLNYLVILLTVVGAALGAMSDSKSGRNLNLIVLLVGGVRLWMGFGFL